jgi:hypothetical protein
MNRSTSDGRVTPAAASWEISRYVNQLVAPDSIRRAAKRIGAVDDEGLIARSVVERMKQTYASTGFLVRRGQRSVEHETA